MTGTCHSSLSAMELCWVDLSFSRSESAAANLCKSICPCPTVNPRILENLNGSIRLGQLTGLMGPSGAGKSTLLKCITGGRTYKGFSGKILVPRDLDVRACFITQDESDHLLMNLTVKESMDYACKLKNSDRVGVNYGEITDDLLRRLDLKEVRDNIVAMCSGGQKKRLAIGMELTSVDKPNFLFLDEPISGLDSYCGLQMVQTLQILAAENNIAIVATIHQPSFKMLSLFHTIFVLTKAGNCIYSGPPGYLVDEIKNIDAKRVTQYDNPADIIIEIASAVDRMDHFSSSEEIASHILIDPEASQVCLKMAGMHAEKMKVRSLTSELDAVREVQDKGLCKNSAKFRLGNLWYLLCRTCLGSIWRQKRFMVIRFALHAIVAIVLACLYNSSVGRADGCMSIMNCTDPLQNCTHETHTVGENPQESLTWKNVKFQFFSLLFLMFAALMPTVLTFPSEIKVFLNEHRNGWYTTFSYYFSKTIAEIPLQCLFPYCYTYFLYWYSEQVDMDHWYEGIFGCMHWRYTYFLGITILCCFVAQGLGFLIGILCVKSFNITIIVSSSVLLFLFLFSGFFVKINQMADSVSWITYFSFIRFSFESLIIILYGFERCKGPMPGLANSAPIITQSAVLKNFDLNDEDLHKNFIWLITHLVLVRLFAFIALKVRSDSYFLSNIVGALVGLGRGIKDFFLYWTYKFYFQKSFQQARKDDELLL